MTRLLKRMLDETEFLSPYRVRALSRAYLDCRYDFQYDGVDYRVKYEPATPARGRSIANRSSAEQRRMHTTRDVRLRLM